MNDSVYFYKISNSTIVCTDKPFGVSKAPINGVACATRSNDNVTFGLLVLCDPVTKETVTPEFLAELGLREQQALAGFRLSDNPVLDRKTGAETGMFWVTTDTSAVAPKPPAPAQPEAPETK